MDSEEFVEIVKKSGLPKGEIAKRLGVSRATINNWEKGKPIPETKWNTIRVQLLEGGINISDEELAEKVVLRQDALLKIPLFKEFLFKIAYREAFKHSTSKEVNE